MKNQALILSLILLGGCFGQADVGPKDVHGSDRVIRVAVIDTGLDESLMNEPWVCKTGHKDYSGAGLDDRHGHGTHIAGLIEQYAKNVILDGSLPAQTKLNNAYAKFCIMVIKYYNPYGNNLENSIDAFKWAIDNGADIINYSGGGTQPSQREKAEVVRALNKGIKIVAAAGNERSDIDKSKYYPAMYDKRIIVVGNLVDLRSRTIATTSNYGASVNTWEQGTNMYSRLSRRKFGWMTGTSQATAVKTGKLVREMLNAK